MPVLIIPVLSVRAPRHRDHARVKQRLDEVLDDEVFMLRLDGRRNRILSQPDRRGVIDRASTHVEHFVREQPKRMHHADDRVDRKLGERRRDE